MAPRLVSDEHVLAGLSGLFRQRGYAGASMNDIASATGLQKSSLYHRFPGGKQQMAAEVASTLGTDFASSVLAPLDDDAPLVERVRAVGRNLAAFYGDGRVPCLLDALSFGEPGAAAGDGLRASANGWIEALAAASREAGRPVDQALALAQDAIAAIEGGLVLARVTGDTATFLRAVHRLPAALGIQET